MRLLVVCLVLIPAVHAEDLDPRLARACPGLAAWVKQHPDASNQGPQPLSAGSNVELTARLHAMIAEDQKAREAAMVGQLDHLDPIKLNHMAVVDHRDLLQLHEIVAAAGVPTPQLIGQQGMNDFWLLVQHADTDVPFQEQILKALSVAGSGVSRNDIAMLTDRIRGHHGLPELYGSGFHLEGTQLVQNPIEDEAHVDERRAKMDMPPLADYACAVRVMYKVAPPK